MERSKVEKIVSGIVFFFLVSSIIYVIIIIVMAVSVVDNLIKDSYFPVIACYLFCV